MSAAVRSRSATPPCTKAAGRENSRAAPALSKALSRALHERTTRFASAGVSVPVAAAGGITTEAARTAQAIARMRDTICPAGR